MRKITPASLERGRFRSGPWGSDPSYGFCGAFLIDGPCGKQLKIIASDGADDGSKGWEHVSISTSNRCPNWQEMCFVKDLFWAENECVVQFHPPKADYVNCHPYCLHLWKNAQRAFDLPPSILVGPKTEAA